MANRDCANREGLKSNRVKVNPVPSNKKGYHVSEKDRLSFVEGQTTISQESTGEDELPSEVHRNPLG